MSTERRAIFQRTGVLCAIAVVILALVAYWPALAHGGWIWDDESYVTENAQVQDPDGLAEIWSLRHDAAKNALVSNTPQYYPIVFTTLWAEHKLWGLDPTGYHVDNVLLHLMNAGLVFLLARRLALPGAPWIAALFALHPMNVESVAWVTERKNVLSGFFYLAAFLAYLRFDDTRRARWFSASLVLFAAALLSKSVTATLPIVVGVALFWRHKKFELRRVAPLGAFLALAILAGWFTTHLERVKVGADGAYFAETFGERALFVAPRAWWHYAQKTLWPDPLAFFYQRWAPGQGGAREYVWPAAIVGLVLVLFAVKRRTGWGPLLLTFVSAITLAPALGFVAVFPHLFSWVADHFAYLATIPLLALGVATVHALARRLDLRLAAAVGAIVLGLFTWRSNVASRSYESLEVLWTDTILKTPTAWAAMNGLGTEWMKSSKRTPDQVQSAMHMFRRAAEFRLGRAQALTNQGLWYAQAGLAAQAIDAYAEALRIEPTRPRARNNLLVILNKLTDDATARCEDRVALAYTARGLEILGPVDALLLRRARVLATSPDAAIRDARTARTLAEDLLRRNPGAIPVLDVLSLACAETGDFESARKHADAAIEIARTSGSAASIAPFTAYKKLFETGQSWRRSPAPGASMPQQKSP